MKKAELCAPGMEITTEDECRDALGYAASLGITLGSRKTVVAGSWNNLPYQCSYQAIGDQAFHFNRKPTRNGKDFFTGAYKMICKQGTILY